jgi:hypothetical protein
MPASFNTVNLLPADFPAAPAQTALICVKKEHWLLVLQLRRMAPGAAGIAALKVHNHPRSRPVLARTFSRVKNTDRNTAFPFIRGTEAHKNKA